MKHMGLWLSEQDWLNLMAPHDRTIVCQDHIAYHDGTNTEHFSTECEGVFLAQPQGPEVMIGNESFRRIVSLDGASSLAEQATEKNFADGRCITGLSLANGSLTVRQSALWSNYKILKQRPSFFLVLLSALNY